MKVLVMNGPNLNMLGKRDPAVYGADTLENVQTETMRALLPLGIETEWWQSNVEGEMVSKIQQCDADALIINAGAYSHYSLAIHDALEILKIPKIEVHISNIYNREAYRRHSVLSEVCTGVIAGLGTYGYTAAALAAAHSLRRNVCLIGMPGSGKTAVAQALARLYGCACFDTDEIFVERNGAIGAFFSGQGEKAFRKIESKIMTELAQTDGVIALGGGAVLNAKAMDCLRERYAVVYLDTSLETLRRRTEGDTARPLLQESGALDKLFKEREPLYVTAADYTVLTDRDDPTKIASYIATEIAKRR